MEVYEIWLQEAQKAVLEAGKLLLNRLMAEQAREKGRNDFVTAVDLTVQNELYRALYAITPEPAFMGEEKDNHGIDLRGYTWILDPVDGTTNLLHDFRHSAISLALALDGTVVGGMIYDPFAGELFTAVRGKGAFLNGEPIHVSTVPTLSRSLCAVGTHSENQEEADKAFRRMRTVYNRCHDIRHMGVSSIELCYVACGRLEGYVEHGLKPWDHAAGALIVEEAGGRCTNFQGGALSLTENSEIIASNGKIHQALKMII